MTTTISEPAILFRLPDDAGRALRAEHRAFQLRDDPEDTQMVNLAWEVARELDAEAGAFVRARLGASEKDSRAYFMRQAERFARVSGALRDAIRDLDERWSKRDQAIPAAVARPLASSS